MQKQENSSVLIFSHPVLRRIDVRFSDKLSRADNRLVIVITLFPCLPEGTPSTQASSHGGVDFQSY